MTLSISIEHNNARLEGSRAFADLGTDPSRILMYDASDVLLVAMVLTKPCGEVVSNKLVLSQADISGDMILTTGSATKAVWVNGLNQVVAQGTVTDDAGSGDFKIAGTSGTLLYAGGRAILGTNELT